jgi:hypothetical protein
MPIETAQYVYVCMHHAQLRGLISTYTNISIYLEN